MQRRLMKSLALSRSSARAATPVHACFATTVTHKQTALEQMGRAAPQAKADKPFLKRVHDEYAVTTPQSNAIHLQIRQTFSENALWSHPVIIDKAEGARFTSIDGHTYIDMLSGFGSSLLGHNNEIFRKVIQDTIESEDYHVGTRNSHLLDASKGVCKATGFDKCYFFESGTTAVHVALRLARAHRKRDLVVLFNNSWHGQSDSTLFISDDEGEVYPVSKGIPEAMTESVAIFDYGDPDAIEALRENADIIAAVILEPIPLKTLRAASKEFLQQLRDVADECGFVLIFDEVITGFRLALGGAQEYFGVKADLATYGKAVGAGMPIGVLAGKQEIMDTISKIAIGGTFCSNGMQLQAVAEVTKYLIDNNEEFYRKMRDNTAILANAATEACKTMKIPLEVVHCESIIRLEFEKWFAKQHLHVVLAFMLALRTNGVYYMTFGPFGFVTEAHTKEIMEEVTKTIVDTLTEFHNADMFPQAA